MGSSGTELDNSAQVISYEEYHPFGSTSFHTVNSGAEVSAKRYRYTGKERDDETGLYYYGARYYAAWLGRWTGCDPSVEDGLNLYVFCQNNPINKVDSDGRWSIDWGEVGRGAAYTALAVAAVAAVVTAGAAAPVVLAAAGASAGTIAAVGTVGTVAVTGMAVVGIAVTVKTVADVATGKDVLTGEQLTDEERSYKLGESVVAVGTLGLGAKGLIKGGPKNVPKTKTSAPKVKAPKVEAPKVEAPKVEAPKVEAPKADIQKPEVPAEKINVDAKVSNISKPARYSRKTEYPHGNRKSVRDEVIKSHTDENGNIIDPETGEIIPKDQVTIEHGEKVVEHWNRIGRNQSKAERTEWYNNKSNLTVKPKSVNSSEGAAAKLKFRQDVGPNYTN